MCVCIYIYTHTHTHHVHVDMSKIIKYFSIILSIVPIQSAMKYSYPYAND